jgi:hypothetical protein
VTAARDSWSWARNCKSLQHTGLSSARTVLSSVSHNLSHICLVLLGKKSFLTIDNKLLIYKTVLKPIWTYGIQLWGCSSKTNRKLIQTAQSKILRTIVNAPWYVSNRTIHTDLRIPYIEEVTKEHSNAHFKKLANHPNPLIKPLLHRQAHRRLQRKWPEDLTY